jgi:hypothetical protein
LLRYLGSISPLCCSRLWRMLGKMRGMCYLQL